ncbi:hypothetical protein J6590_025354, partial [Homalodisca vitripennis]
NGLAAMSGVVVVVGIAAAAHTCPLHKPHLVLLFPALSSALPPPDNWFRNVSASLEVNAAEKECRSPGEPHSAVPTTSVYSP